MGLFNGKSTHTWHFSTCCLYAICEILHLSDSRPIIKGISVWTSWSSVNNVHVFLDLFPVIFISIATSSVIVLFMATSSSKAKLLSFLPCHHFLGSPPFVCFLFILHINNVRYVSSLCLTFLTVIEDFFLVIKFIQVRWFFNMSKSSLIFALHSLTSSCFDFSSSFLSKLLCWNNLQVFCISFLPLFCVIEYVLHQKLLSIEQ